MGTERSSSKFSPLPIGSGKVCWQVDNDSLEAPLDDGNWELELAKSLIDLAEEYEDSEMSCATYGAASTDFGHLGFSVWIACAGPSPMTKACGDLIADLIPAHCLRKALTTPSQYWNERIRLADGKVWRPEDAATWVELARSPTTFEEPKDDDDESGFDFQPDDCGEEAESQRAINLVRQRRTRVARGGVRVGYYQKKIERQLGLPVGSVKFVNPDGSKAYAHLLVGSLRKRWEE